MIKELIFILFLVVIFLVYISQGPRSILRAESRLGVESTEIAKSNVVPESKSEKMEVRKSKKTSRVRFSPEKKERVYNVKTGQIVSESVVPVDEIEN